MFIFLHRLIPPHNFARTPCQYMSRGNAVSIMSDYRLDDQSSISGRSKGFFLQPVSRPAEDHPASCPMVPGVLSPELKRGRGVTLTTHPPPSAEVKNEEELYFLSLLAPALRSGTAILLFTVLGISVLMTRPFKNR
jgi:hypothetical protein